MPAISMQHDPESSCHCLDCRAAAAALLSALAVTAVPKAFAVVFAVVAVACALASVVLRVTPKGRR